MSENMRQNRRSDRGLTLIEIIISVSIMGFMFVWILQALIGGYYQESRSTDRTVGAVAAATVIDQILDCISADPRFFSPQRLLELEIIEYDKPHRFEHRALFVNQKTSVAGLPDEWKNLKQSKLFKAFDIPSILTSDNSGNADLAFIMTITDEFDPKFPDKAASSLCKKASVEVYRLKDLQARREVPIFKVTRTCFLAPNLSLELPQIKAINAEFDDTDKALMLAIDEMQKLIEPSLKSLDEFPEAQKFSTALMMIATEMNRAAYECRGKPLPGVARPPMPAGELPFWGYETMIASLEPPLASPDQTTEGIIKRATLHRRAAIRILEAHKRCLGPARLIKTMVEDLEKKVNFKISSNFFSNSEELQQACNNAASQVIRLENAMQSKTPLSDANNIEIASASVAAINRLVLCAQNWDAVFYERENLRLLQLTSLYFHLFSSVYDAMAELESLPQRYFKHLRAARDRYADLLKLSDDKLTSHALTIFANHAIETQYALALTGTDTINTSALLKTLNSHERLKKEAPLLLRDYWGAQKHTAPGMRGLGAQEFFDRNASYTRDVIPSLIGLLPDSSSFAAKFPDAKFPPQNPLRLAINSLESKDFRQNSCSPGGFIKKVNSLYFRVAPILARFDRAIKSSGEKRNKGIVNNMKILYPSIEQLLATSTHRPCANLEDILNKLKDKQ